MVVNLQQTPILARDSSQKVRIIRVVSQVAEHKHQPTRPATSEEGPNYARATITRPYHLIPRLHGVVTAIRPRRRSILQTKTTMSRPRFMTTA